MSYSFIDSDYKNIGFEGIVTMMYDTVIIYPEKRNEMFKKPVGYLGKSYFDTNVIFSGIVAKSAREVFLIREIKGFTEEEAVIELIFDSKIYGTFKERGCFSHKLSPLLVRENNNFHTEVFGFNEKPFMIKVELVGILSRKAG